MLLLLTLIGVAGMRDTLLQEKMAGNMRDREIALQAAESALRAGEAQLAQLTEPVFTNTNGLYDHNTPAGLAAMQRKKSGVPVTEQVFWQQATSWTAAKSITYPFALDDVNNPPRYVIEKLTAAMSTDKSTYTGGTDPNFVTNITANVEVPDPHISYPDYRVTARGEGPTGDAIVILQATFRRVQ
ncbi:MAG: hypothetical protein IPK95_11020 [Cellvibrionales bacterium]|nr:hypothetical protein [Cellvibrionales bacterium]